MNTIANEAEQRAAIVAAARSWIGTPYHNCADVKGAGVDCGMLLVRVFVDTGLVAPFDPRPYPPDWHLHRAEEKYLGFVFDHAHEVEAPQPGDVAVFRFGRCYSHGGIVTRCQETGIRDPDRIPAPDTCTPMPDIWIVHAYAPAGCVLEERVHQNATLSEPIRKPRFFSWWLPTAISRARFGLAGGMSAPRETFLKRRANGLEGGMSAPRETLLQRLANGLEGGMSAPRETLLKRRANGLEGGMSAPREK